jgi:hypothetical protein
MAIAFRHDLGSPRGWGAGRASREALSGRGLYLCSLFTEGIRVAQPPAPRRPRLYPADQYPDGRWDYYRFYLTHFGQTVTDFNVDIPATLAAIYRRGNPESVGKVYRSALVTRNGGWFGSPCRDRRQQNV